MHEYLRSIGFSSCTTRRELQKLTEWVLEKPDHVSVIPVNEESNLAVAERECGGHAGVAVVGEIDESGTLIPEYYYPYLVSTMISSEARISYEHQRTKNALIGMCEDDRLGMALIFSVRNMAEVLHEEMNAVIGTEYSRVSLSALASDAMVLLPTVQSEKLMERQRSGSVLQEFQESAENGDVSALQEIAEREMNTYRHVAEHLRDTDVFTLVDSFFMPHGMDSDQYYLMGTITGKQLIRNELTGEEFYRIIIVSSGISLPVAVNVRDLQGIPMEGCRLKCHVWVTGDLRR